MNDILTTISAGDTLTGTHWLAYAAFGRDIARFQQLIDFLTWLSIILWCFVILTTLLRAGAHILHSRSERRLQKRNYQNKTLGRDRGSA
jgi:hypothetical protein